jgi:hypothetical protein
MNTTTDAMNTPTDSQHDEMEFVFNRSFKLPMVEPSPDNEIVIYIKRAEISQTKKYIRGVIERLLGHVLLVDVEEKTNAQNGSKYNGVRVTVDKLHNTCATKKLAADIRSSADAMRVFHCSNKYWMISEHKQRIREPRTQRPVQVDIPSGDLSDSERISKLEEMVRSLNAKLNACQKSVERHNTISMDYEFEHSIMRTHNIELKLQNEELKRQLEELK